MFNFSLFETEKSLICKLFHLLWFTYPPSLMCEEDSIVDVSSLLPISVPVSSPAPCIFCIALFTCHWYLGVIFSWYIMVIYATYLHNSIMLRIYDQTYLRCSYILWYYFIPSHGNAYLSYFNIILNLVYNFTVHLLMLWYSLCIGHSPRKTGMQIFLEVWHIFTCKLLLSIWTTSIFQMRHFYFIFVSSVCCMLHIILR